MIIAVKKIRDIVGIVYINMTLDLIFEVAKNMNEMSRSSSQYGNLSLLRDILMELDNLNLGVTSKACLLYTSPSPRD